MSDWLNLAKEFGNEALALGGDALTYMTEGKAGFVRDELEAVAQTNPAAAPAINSILGNDKFDAAFGNSVVTDALQKEDFQAALKASFSGEGANPLSALPREQQTAIYDAVSTKILTTLEGAEAVTLVNGAINITNNGQTISLDQLTKTEGFKALLDQPISSESPALLQTLGGNLALKSAVLNLVEQEPGALAEIEKMMAEGAGGLSGDLFTKALENPAISGKLVEIIDETAARPDISFGQVAGALQTMSKGELAEGWQDLRALDFKTEIAGVNSWDMTSAFGIAAGGMAVGQMWDNMPSLSEMGSGLMNMLKGFIEMIGQFFSNHITPIFDGLFQTDAERTGETPNPNDSFQNAHDAIDDSAIMNYDSSGYNRDVPASRLAQPGLNGAGV